MNFSELTIKEAHHQDELKKKNKKQESQKSLKHKIVANEINALKEKCIKLTPGNGDASCRYIFTGY